MDAGVLIIIVLVSLGLIVGAVVALWLRGRSGSSVSTGGSLPTAPAPAAPSKRRDQAADKATKEILEPPRGGAINPPSPPPAAAPSFGAGGVPTPLMPQPVVPPPPAVPAPGSMPAPPAPPMQPQAPAAVSPFPLSPPAPVQPTQRPQPLESQPAVPPKPQAPPHEEPPPAARAQPLPEPADEQPKMEDADDETEATPAADDLLLEESGALAGAIPELPLLDDSYEAETRSRSSQGAVLFSAYYPKEVAPEQWQPLHAYIFRDQATGAVEADAGERLGKRAGEFRGVRAPAQADVPEGALVTATPHLDGFQFNPPSVSIGFYKDWHRFDFEVRAKGAPLNQSANGLLTFSVEGIIVADVPLSIFVGATTSAGEQTNSVAKVYQSIFCSYSHRDQQIVARAERAYKALGLDYLRDVVSLKSGQEWSDELLALINRADIFQLFWSRAAAQSEHVRYEWEHALQVAGWRANFIRPVYWEDPQPDIPQELKHIHFAFQPDLSE